MRQLAKANDIAINASLKSGADKQPIERVRSSVYAAHFVRAQAFKRAQWSHELKTSLAREFD